ncbi:MAG TPA: ABC transporter permease [Vicinamibacterales bacterium]|nr:ABC transporter permease [Vicinamibacterales bacterium]
MMRRLWRRARVRLNPRRLDEDVRREIDDHLVREIEARERTGLSREDARRAALRAFGDPTRVLEQVRDARGITFWDALRQDVRFGLRTLRRSPGFTLAGVLILSLGIGANTAIFSVIYGVLLAPLPFRNGQELVLVQQSALKSGRENAGVSIQELQDYRARLESVRDLVEYHSMSFTLLNRGEPDRVATGVVSANFFDMLGIRPGLGRSFVDTDDDLGAEAVLILSHAYWRQKFGADPHIVGRVLEMNNKPHTVVGVLPAFPQYPRENDVYMPTSACPFRASSEAEPTTHRTFSGLRVFGRLAPAATLERASTEVATIAQSFERDYPKDHEQTRSLGFTGAAVPLAEQLVTNARSALYMLGGTTLLVLLIASANVANLALARTLRRSRELAVRAALGAGRGRLIRQLLTESVLLAIAGGALGVFLAWLSLDLLVGFVARFTPRTGQIAVDGGVLTFALVVSLATGVFFGIAPALTAGRSLSSAIRDGGAPAGEGLARRRVRSGLVVAQVAVSFALVVGAALLLQSFYRLATTPLGFESDRVMTAAVFSNWTSQATNEDARRFESKVLETLRSTPNVRAVALTQAVPQSAIVPDHVRVTLENVEQDPGSRLETDRNFVSDQYFEALGVPLLAGRDFRSGDTPEAPPVAIVNASMARLWKGSDPVGRRFTAIDFDGEQTFTVVGVAADYRLYSVEQENPAQYYRALSQFPGGGSRLLVRVEGDAAGAVPLIKAAVHGADPKTAVEEFATIAEIRRTAQLAVPALTTALLSLFALVALAITLAGIGGIVGTTVSQRTHEFGLRMALGATRAAVLRHVLGRGLVLVGLGVALGLAGAFVFGRMIASELFATTPTDPLAYTIVAILFFAATLGAALGPARRATTIDPIIALRTE